MSQKRKQAGLGHSRFPAVIVVAWADSCCSEGWRVPRVRAERGVQNRNLNAQTIPFVAGFFNALAAGLQKVDIYVNNDDYHQQAGLSLTIKRSHFAFIVAINRVHSVVKQSYPFTSAETIIVRS